MNKFSFFNKYVIATVTGGTMEQNHFEYTDFDIIISKDRDTAVINYNKQHLETYTYGKCLAAKVNDKIEIYDDSIPDKWIEKLKE